MADEIDDVDVDVDGILDEALEEFEQTKPIPKTTPEKQSNSKKEDDDLAPSSTIPEESEALPRPDEINPAFQEALQALGNLGLGQEKVDDDVTESDLKLVEEFMTSLSSSLHGLGGSASDKNQNSTNDIGSNGSKPQPEVEKLVDSIVGHLLSEDVLKGPMIQMRAAYADWLPKHAERLSAEELGRYSRQQELIETICEKYELDGKTSEIMELLSQMQDTGSPPEDVMKSLNSSSGPVENSLPGMPAEDLDKLTENCAMQ